MRTQTLDAVLARQLAQPLSPTNPLAACRLLPSPLEAGRAVRPHA